jgi:pantetheine-phosphate adenylyltransferase
MSTPVSARRVAVYSGTFDPLTLGHEDVVRRAAGLFDELVLAVAVAHHKKTLFTLDERIAMARAALADLPHVRVEPFDGLIMDFCREQGACAVLRGVRNVTDFDYEAQMAAMNRKLLPSVETVFLLPQAELQCISSTLVREISKLGGDIAAMVSAPVAAELARLHGPARVQC